MKVKKILWLLSSFLIVGCSTVSNNTPDEMVRKAVKRHITQDKQYNFSGKINFLLDDIDGGLMTENKTDKTIEENIDVDVTDKKVNTKLNTPKKSKTKNSKRQNIIVTSDDDDDCGNTDRSVKEIFMNQIADTLKDNFSLPFNGAVDMSKGKFELIPEIRYEAPNALISLKLPVQLDVKNKILVVDARAVKPITNILTSIKHPDKISDKPYIAGKIPDDINQSPMKNLIKIIPQAIDDGWAAIDKKNFVQLPLDENGRKIGARKQIRITSDNNQQKLMIKVILNSIKEQLEAQDKKSSSEITDNMDNMLKSLSEVDIDSLLDNTKDENPIQFYLSVLDFYLDENDRILGIREKISISPNKISKSGQKKRLTTTFWIHFNYTTQPKFIINSTPKNTVYHDLPNKLKKNY